MINYYEILGVHSGATIAEIKAAFRQLAKTYHPDVNPNGKEHFEKILKAYETLSDPLLKASYDYKLHYYQTRATETKKTGTKTWSFDEREMKRRQYYNEHIKKYAKTYPVSDPATEAKSNYNEFKYILLATPLAVILFICVMSLATSSDSSETEIKQEVRTKTSDLKMGDAPYTEHFGGSLYYNDTSRSILFKNLTGNDIIVCLFTKENFVRSFFIEKNFSAEVTQLPSEPLEIKYNSGRYFDTDMRMREAGVMGGFTEDQKFFRSRDTVRAGAGSELTFTGGVSDGFELISEKEFFSK